MVKEGLPARGWRRRPATRPHSILRESTVRSARPAGERSASPRTGQAAMLHNDPIREQTNASQPAGSPLGRVLSVRGSQADIGLPAASPFDAEEIRVTV